MATILHFIYGLHVGGAETFLVNVLEHLDSKKFHCDFAIQDSNITNGRLLKYISDYNSRIHILPKFPQSIIAQYKALKEVLLSKHYDIVHIHMNAAVNPVPLLLSIKLKGLGIKFIVHSHSSTNNVGGILGKQIHKINTHWLIGNKSAKVACSQLAGKWMFGKHDFTVINNAVDTEQFKFNPEARINIRRELGISENTDVIGSVARFVYAKNHQFMIEFFARYVKTHPNSLLLLVGTGELLEGMKTLAEEKGISDKVIFTGLRTDIPELLSAMDCFFIPSHFEGLAFSVVEAQASGLRVAASDSITTMINIGDYVSFVSLDASYEDWEKAMDTVISETRGNDRCLNPVKGSGFDVDKMIEQIELLYSQN